MPVSAVFELKNNGKHPLYILGVKPDCGCTAVNVSKNVLKHGEECTIKLTYDAHMLGHFVKQAMVSYGQQPDQTSGKELLLTMKGVVLSELKDYSSIYPYTMGNLLVDKNVIEFDDVNKGDHPEQILSIHNNGFFTLTPNIEHLPPYLSAIATPEQLKPGQSGKVVLMLNSQYLNDYGLTQTTVYLGSQLGEKISPENEIPVSIVLLPDLSKFQGGNMKFAPKLQLSQPELRLGMVDGKQRKKTVLTITNQGRLPLEISAVQMFTKGLTVTFDKLTLQPKEQTRVKVVGDLDVLKKARTKPRILMITSDPEHSKVVIPVVVK
jgi:hypothetical protein